MEELIGKVYSVERVPKTAKRIFVGDFKTIGQAEKAMLEHFRNTPKRGNFYYGINEAELQYMGGTLMRSINLFSGYHKRYTKEDLQAMVSCGKQEEFPNQTE